MTATDKDKTTPQNEILKDSEFPSKYPSDNSTENYIVRIQLLKNDILISAKENNNLVPSFYEKKFSINDFHKLLGDFSAHYKTLEDIYNFLFCSLREKEISISNITNNISLTLSTKLEAKYKDPLIVNIILSERKCNKDELIESLRNEIKDLKGEISKVKDENNKLKSLRNEINDLKGDINKVKVENNKLKNQISNKKDINIQSGVKEISINLAFWFPTPREVIQHINFNKKYDKIPKVMVSLNGMALSNNSQFNGKNDSINLFTKNIDFSGFDICILSNINADLRVNVSWISYE